MSGIVRAVVTETCLYLERASSRRFDLDGWLLHAGPGAPPPAIADGGSLVRLEAAERMQRAAVEDAGLDLRRVSQALVVNQDLLAQRWHLYRRGEEEAWYQCEREEGRVGAGGAVGGGLTLLEQYSVEIAFLWAKHCVVHAQLVVLFSLGHFSPQLGPPDRRDWCRQAFRSLSSVCVA